MSPPIVPTKFPIPFPDPPIPPPVLLPTETSRQPGSPYGGFDQRDRETAGTAQESQETRDQRLTLQREFNLALSTANASGELSTLDAVDNFRQTLTPELQAQYDAQLQTLRNDPRIEFQYEPGVQPSPNRALEDMVLRGMVAATFGNEDLMNATIDAAVANNDVFNGGQEGDGHLVLSMYPDDRLYDPPSTDTAAGLAIGNNGELRFDVPYMIRALSIGDSVPQHEFSHFVQGYNRPEGSNSPFPQDFPYGNEMLSALASTDFVERGAETWPDLQNRFRQYPEVLAQEHPEIYRMMAEYTGYDPLTQQSSTPVRLDGTGDIKSATGTLQQYFAQAGGGDDFITRDELQLMLDNPNFDLPSDVRAAAAYLLSSPTAMNVADVASNGGADADGRISLGDLQAVNGLADSREYAYTLLDTASGNGARDHYISRDDVTAALNDPGIPPEIRSQIQDILKDNPQLNFGLGVRY